MKTLVIIAHPDIEHSRGNRALRDAIAHDPNVTVRELYKLYPDFRIDAALEQQLIREHGNIVLQFPMYWYNCPPLLKKWLDDVINDTLFGSAPEKSLVLKGRTLQLAVTIGRVSERYFPPTRDYVWADDVARPYLKPELLDRHGTDIVEVLLTPFEQTAHLAGMEYGHPFVTYNVGPLARMGSINDQDMLARAQEYLQLLQRLDPVTQEA
ncbi:NAD(P)H dehydrogenase [Paraburkholderia sp. Ac-20340]|uniref:NAD(P)H-dependent oxidoreductase n=1 Tax=Paraburkholderia sp. Ac-20340 TaxID=2703888 RepID=UPI0019815D6F|nr:NAD(P)H-dependent oxidoreductase [Paraburkholderia sp. Ac-20340]MBN3857534.1 NAD(P)H dehydrogenase [Paraburkholderia sp. Ac-20340]